MTICWSCWSVVWTTLCSAWDSQRPVLRLVSSPLMVTSWLMASAWTSPLIRLSRAM
ncbi:hypothetical protein EVA_13374 [gut metagenome]|uniref:Uncharacterized protein n=1 Tax=gut metagenome TaxID=749906 RepID=J9FVH5_9ZZZZ